MSSANVRMDGEVGVVTGGGSGIGRAVCVRLAEMGCSVVVADINIAGATQTVQLLNESGAGDRVVALSLDVTNNESVNAWAADVLGSLGTPTVIVNAAGIDKTEMFLENDLDFWDKLVEVNFLGVARVCRALLPAMIERRRGSIINIASDAARVGSSGEAVYSGTKGGVIAFTKSLAREMARHNIRANCVSPGPTETPMFYGQSEKVREALVRVIPLRRIAQPEEIADAVYFFSSDLSQFVTGQVLSVSGGITMAG